MTALRKSLVQLRFEEVAVSFGVNCFKVYDNNPRKYTNKTTQKAFELYNLGRSDYKFGHGSNFVIGKIVRHSNGKTIEFSKEPKIHTSPTTARTELDRLCNTYPGETFLLFSSVVAKSVQDNRITYVNTKDDTMGIDRVLPLHTYADDGFGNLIKNQFHTRLTVYNYINNDINI